MSNDLGERVAATSAAVAQLESDARKTGDKDFADAEARNDARVKVSEAKAEERIRRGLESDGDSFTKKTLLSLSARVKTLESTVARLSEKSENPARALAALADKIDAATPGRVRGCETEKLEARKEPGE